MSLPEIRIKYAWLLAENASVGLNELWGNGESLLSPREYNQIAKSYHEAWAPYEERILSGMCELLGLEFRQNIIDVYIAPWFRAFSDPIVIGVIYSPDRFIELLTHELIHRLLTDNVQVNCKTQYKQRWQKLFGDEHSFGVLVHIPVHAVYRAVFDDVLNEPQRTQNDIRAVRQDEDYCRAWVYVEEHGHKEIVNQLKEDYKELAT